MIAAAALIALFIALWLWRRHRPRVLPVLRADIYVGCLAVFAERYVFGHAHHWLLEATIAIAASLYAEVLGERRAPTLPSARVVGRVFGRRYCAGLLNCKSV